MDSPDSYVVVLLPAAYSDLDEIFDYIMTENPAAVTSMLDKIMKALRRLETFPLSGTMLLERSLKEFSFRMIVITPNVAYYRLIDNRIYIYRILHGARNQLHLLEHLPK